MTFDKSHNYVEALPQVFRLARICWHKFQNKFTFYVLSFTNHSLLVVCIEICLLFWDTMINGLFINLYILRIRFVVDMLGDKYECFLNFLLFIKIWSLSVKVEALWFKCFIVFLENLVLGTFICADNEAKIKKKIGWRLHFWDTGVAKTTYCLQITRFATQSNTGSSTNQY